MDYALLELENDIEFSDKASPACLPKRNADHYDETVTVSGWGTIRQGGPTATALRKVDDLKVVRNSRCGSYPRTTIRLTANMLCAVSTGRQAKDSCQGDSGGKQHQQ